MSTLNTYAPSADWVAHAHVKGEAGYAALVAEAEADYAGYWARLARELLSWQTPFTKTLNDIELAVLEPLEERQAQCLLQLSGPACGGGQGRQDSCRRH